MKMKKEAKGDERVPPEKRVYLYVEAEARTTSAKIPKGTFWYSKVRARFIARVGDRGC